MQARLGHSILKWRGALLRVLMCSRVQGVHAPLQAHLGHSTLTWRGARLAAPPWHTSSPPAQRTSA